MVWAGPTDQLTHRWPMDDANVVGTSIKDIVGGLNGTAGTTVTSAPGPYTTAREIGNDANAGISLSSDPIADLLTADYSIGCWLWLADVTQDTYQGAGTFPRFLNFIAGANRIHGYNSTAGGQIGVSNTAANATLMRVTDSPQRLTNGTWAHFCATFANASDTTLLYWNGDLQGFSGGTDNNTSVTANTIGCRGAIGERPWIGRLSQMVTYTKVLSPTEVAQLYRAEDGSSLMNFQCDLTARNKIIAY